MRRGGGRGGAGLQGLELGGQLEGLQGRDRVVAWVGALSGSDAAARLVGQGGRGRTAGGGKDAFGDL